MKSVLSQTFGTFELLKMNIEKHIHLNNGRCKNDGIITGVFPIFLISNV